MRKIRLTPKFELQDPAGSCGYGVNHQFDLEKYAVSAFQASHRFIRRLNKGSRAVSPVHPSADFSEQGSQDEFPDGLL
jgi:hypothetical protein